MTMPLTDAGSERLYARTTGLLPGGVNSPVRAMRSIGRDPLFIERGEGAEIVDVDGNRYLDWVCSWGPLVPGQRPAAVVAAIQAAAERGTSFGAPTAVEVELAAGLVQRVPGVEMVRMTSSGTEAAMSAVRLARAVTGRDLVLRFAGAYHGHVDGLLAAAGSGLAAQGIPASPGVPAPVAAQTVVIPWNDRAALEAAVDEHDLAAILAEPYPANMGLVPPEPGFLESLRAAADANGCLLIFDEVISGFRVARGGAQELAGVRPDLTVMGKIIGGGLPGAAFGGRRELMERIAPAGDVYQAGTLSGNPVAATAGIVALSLLDDDAYVRLGQLTQALADAIRAAADDRPVQVQSAPGLLTVFFSPDPVRDYAGARECDLVSHAAWCRALLEHGVYPPPSQFEAWFPSLAHTDADVERTAAAAAAAFERVP